MKCPHCRTSFHDYWDDCRLIWRSHFTGWYASVTYCPECTDVIVAVSKDFTETRNIVYPHTSARGPVPNEIPSPIAQDYLESCNVLDISTKASAALARRCLQNILNSHGYKGRDLSKQIDALLNETDTSRAVGSSLRDTVDAVRNFGNFSAHPIDDQTTLQIVDVEPEEAEWCLQIIEEMFDHFYVRPAQAAARKAALNAKLSAAGKPLAK